MKIILSILVLIIFSCDQNKEKHRIWTEEDRQFLIRELSLSFTKLEEEILPLSDQQWNFRESDDRWSIAYVVEHLDIHESLYYRELSIHQSLPYTTVPINEMNDPDSIILSYQFITSANTGSAPWYLEPNGRWSSKESVINHYKKLRESMINLIKNTEQNFRAYATSSGRGLKKYRDLHQLVLISIAHTRRHISQIKAIKRHPLFPNQ